MVSAPVKVPSLDEDIKGSGSDEQDEWPLWKLCIIAIPQLGVQVLWMFLGPNTTPYLKTLGASESFATLNNSAGPLVGFVVGPLVGSWSDQSTSKWGRRRPIIVAGLLSTLVAGLLYSGAPQLMGKNDGALYLAASMQWVLDFTINAMQTPFRALVADLAAPDKQLPMQIFFAVVCAVGGFLAFSIMKIYNVAIHHMLELMSIIMLVNIFCVGLALSVAREKQFVPDEKKKGEKSDIFAAFRGMPKVFILLIFVQCTVWFGNTIWAVYGKEWFTHSVFVGDSEAKEGSEARDIYIQGSNAFSTAGQIGSLFNLAISFAFLGLGFTPIPKHLIFAGCIFVGAGVCFFSAFIVGHDSTLASTAFILSNVALTASGSIPFGIVAVWNKAAEMAGKAGSVAMLMAIMNCCITVGQQLCTMLLGGLEASYDLVDSIKYLFIISMVANAVAGVAALFLNVGVDAPGKEDQAEEYRGLAQEPPP